MQKIHIKNLEKYNPGYTDRNLIWCKMYFSMINSSYDFENMDDIDKWRLIALIMLELQMKKPIPLDDKWLQNKISNNKRHISLTLKVLHNFIDIVTDDEEPMLPRIEKNRIEKKQEIKITHLDFIKLSKAELEKLHSKYGISLIQIYIEKLNEYIGSKGKKYSSHYFTILSWIRRDKEFSKDNSKSVKQPDYKHPEPPSEADQEEVKEMISKTAKEMKI